MVLKIISLLLFSGTFANDVDVFFIKGQFFDFVKQVKINNYRSINWLLIFQISTIWIIIERFTKL
jgi:hypothetical protein